MATPTILIAATTFLLSAPLVTVAYVLSFLKSGRLARDLQKCMAVVDTAPSLPAGFVSTLVAAEDHRSAIHPGIDPIAILRALWIRARFDLVQGASTIEQQLVRVVLDRYERTIRRKLREQIIAVMLASRRSKKEIAVAYLSMAFYGSGQHGISGLMHFCREDLYAATQEEISQMIARLKYPQPLSPTAEWHRKIRCRVRYIASRLPNSVDLPLAKRPLAAHASWWFPSNFESSE